jgi:DNA-nicking Smr family endonuclease
VKKKEDLSNIDKAQWEEYLKDPKDIFDKELVNKKSFNKNHRFRFDLHGFTLLEANEKVKELINICQKKSFKEILLITGKGLHSNVDQNAYISKELSKLRFSVPEYIKSQKELSDKVIAIDQAGIVDGGEGAIIIKLKNL